MSVNGLSTGATMKTSAFSAFLVCTVLSLLICTPLPAVTWYVDDSVSSSGDGESWQTAFQTIQEGIDAAGEGDTVIVAEGTYAENIQFNNKNITLRSTDPSDPTIVANTVMDGEQSGAVVTFAGTEDETCIMQGFAIRNGIAEYGGGICGGTDGNRTHATLRYNRIIGNEAREGGGGLAYCDGAILDSAITDNSAIYEGGGLYQCGGLIAGNTLARNTTKYENGGGLAYCQGAIRNNVIRDNSSDKHGGGLYECDGGIRNNTISANSADGFGSGLYGCDGAIQNNVILANTGSGLSNCDGTIENNTVSGNSVGLSECRGAIRNCIIWGNVGSGSQNLAYFQLSDCSAPSYSCIQAWSRGGVENIAYDPYFANPDGGDYHLSTWSPCIDAGDPSSPFSNEPKPNGARINMGAYGNTSEATSRSADSDHDNLPDDWEIKFFGGLIHHHNDDPDKDLVPNFVEYRYGHDPTASPTWYVDAAVTASGEGTAWANAFQTIQEGVDAARDGNTVLVAQGTYVENIKFNGNNIVLRSMDPLNPSGVANTIIDGSRSDPVVTFSGDENPSCTLAGFTIRNGRWGGADPWEGLGGGIYGLAWDSDSRSRATICHNTVANNYRAAIGYCDGLITNNLIIANEGAKSPCGIACCDGTIENNVITANFGGSYGAIYSCDGTIHNNIITENMPAGAGALLNCHGVIQNNLIAGNSAKYGGALSQCSGLIQNNTIFGNSALEDGGGLHDCFGEIRNCVIWGNTAGGQGDQIWNSNAPSFCCIEKWEGGGTGNIVEDPLLVNPDGGDFHLQDGSPCSDAGVNFYWLTWPQKDLDGNCRLFGQRVDMGCYEYGSSPDSDGDLFSDNHELAAKTDWNNPDSDGDGLRDGLEMLRGSDPFYPTPPKTVHVPSESPTIQENLCLAVNGDEIFVSAGKYRENLHFCGPDVILRRATPETYQKPTPVILDGGGQGSVVSFTGEESGACILSGFVIRNGSGLYGGGIRGGTSQQHTRATIESCIVTANSAMQSGGGIAYCDGLIRTALVYGNHAKNTGGGAAYCGGTIESSTFAWNLSDYYRGVEISSDVPTIHNSIVWAKPGTKFPVYLESRPTYSCVPTDRLGEGSIAQDPQFVDPENGDFRLRPGSPCIDTGDNSSVPLPDTDIVGMHRIMFGGKSLTVDMGALEYYINEIGTSPDTGEATFTWSSFRRRKYSVYYSDDLISWHLATDIRSTTDTTMSWIDDGSLTGIPPSLVPSRYYRVLENP